MLLIGASRGLGLALAEAYLQLGWRVVAHRAERPPIRAARSAAGP
jgi:NAD(P)-dependent dehydrogenase (short-subunit alcohol dehydrogenase family)